MPSPFPGMDPYLEHPSLWPDVHSTLPNVLRELLADRLPPHYWVGLERRVYIEYEETPPPRLVVPDLAIVAGSPVRGSAEPAAARSQAASGTFLMEVPDLQPVEVREIYLVVRDLPARSVVTIVELLSLANKSEGMGRHEYLSKRGEVLRTRTNLVEIDLLRAGTPLPLKGNCPAAHYHVFTYRGERRPTVEALGWGVRDPLPRIAVPLRPGDPDAELDLGSALRSTYARGWTAIFSAAARNALR